jgi:membrane protein implicated in regulation of membrane protease activity
MSGSGNLDLRIPVGGLFVALGLILAGYGLITSGNTAMYVRSTSLNVNLWWGLVMLAFGAVFIGLAVRASRGTRE